MDHTLTMRTVLLDGSDGDSLPDLQTTQYVYGVTTGGGSDLASHDLLAEIRYPDKTTGAPGTANSDKVRYAYNALGQLDQLTDQNGTVHVYEFDVLGRTLRDKITKTESSVFARGQAENPAKNQHGTARIIGLRITKNSAKCRQK